jgi:AbrB family looped-hinge helix DNA binding protein
MSVRVGERGQVVIPKVIRDEAGIHPGDQVDFEFRGGEVVLVRRGREAKPLAGRFAGSGMLEAHMADRAKERERDRW